MFSSKFRNILIRKLLCEAKQKTSKFNIFSSSSVNMNNMNGSKSATSNILEFLELVGSLKHIKRTGWVLRNVDNCESISGHMYRMSMMTFLIDDSLKLDRLKCMQLALVHDLAESIVGDITPFCGISKEQKRSMELKAMEDICKLIEPRGNQIMELFLEYEEGKSPEANFVKDLDRLDMVLQAFEYERRDNCISKHQEFFDSTEGKFEHPFVKNIVQEIYNQRNQSISKLGTENVNGNAKDSSNLKIDPSSSR